MVKRAIEYRSPHYRKNPEPPPEFGKPRFKPKPVRRSPLSHRPAPAPSRELGLVPALPPQPPEGSVFVPLGRGWETYVIDRGTGTQEEILGRSYTIGKDHSPVDVYSFPPDKPEGVWVGTVRMARIVALKPPKESKKNDDSDKLSKRWTDAVVLKGVSKRPVEELMLFDNGYGQSMIIQARWGDIRRTR